MVSSEIARGWFRSWRGQQLSPRFGFDPIDHAVAHDPGLAFGSRALEEKRFRRARIRHDFSDFLRIHLVGPTTAAVPWCRHLRQFGVASATDGWIAAAVRRGGAVEKTVAAIQPG